MGRGEREVEFKKRIHSQEGGGCHIKYNSEVEEDASWTESIGFSNFEDTGDLCKSISVEGR